MHCQLGLALVVLCAGCSQPPAPVPVEETSQYIALKQKLDTKTAAYEALQYRVSELLVEEKRAAITIDELRGMGKAKIEQFKKASIALINQESENAILLAKLKHAEAELKRTLDQLGKTQVALETAQKEVDSLTERIDPGMRDFDPFKEKGGA